MEQPDHITKSVIDITNDMVTPLGGKALSAVAGRRPNFEVTGTSSANTAICIAVEVEFSNPHILGSGDYYEDVYRRYRALRSDWWQLLAKHGFSPDSDAPVVTNLMPILSATPGPSNTPYRIQPGDTKGVDLFPIDKLIPTSPYYAQLQKKYGVQYALCDQYGVVVGPDGGLLASVDAACKVVDKNDIRLADIGAGTGAVTAFCATTHEVSTIAMCEYSDDLLPHLDSYRDKLTRYCPIQLHHCDCRQFTFDQPFDVVSIGVFYGIQPTLLKLQGHRLSASIGDHGIAIFQSGMIEGLFNTLVLTGQDERLHRWPWYDQSATVSALFAHHEAIVVADEVMVCATNNPSLLSSLINELNAPTVEQWWDNQRRHC